MTRTQKIAEYASKASEVQAEGLTWVEHYNCYQTSVAGWLSISVNWASDGQGYNVVVAGRQLKTRSRDREAMLKLAVNTAKAWLAKATAQLAENNFEKSEKNTGQGGATNI